MTFAKEGTAATKPENYLLEEKKALIGDWKSVSVTNVLGYDISNEIDPTALKATFNYDHSATINFMGEEIGSSQWSLFTEMIIFTDDFGNNLSISGDYEDGELTINCSNDDFYYVFTMSKQ